MFAIESLIKEIEQLRHKLAFTESAAKLLQEGHTIEIKALKVQIKELTEANNELTEACDLYRDELDTFKTTTSPKALPTTLDAAQLLQLSADTLTERGKQYDSSGANKERSMSAVVKSFNTIYGTNLTEQQGWNFMVLLKMKRGADKPHQDSALDMIAYAALAGETVFNS